MSVGRTRSWRAWRAWRAWRGSRTLGATLALLAAAACNASRTEDVVPPVTGIRIDTLGLFGADSCGLADSQIAKISVTVSAAAPGTGSAEAGAPGGGAAEILRSGTFDCFAEPAFVEPFAGDAEYKLRVYGYSARRFQETLNDAQGNPLPSIDELIAKRGAAEARDADEQLSARASAVATCTATQYANVYSTAACVLESDLRPAASSNDGGRDAGELDAGSAEADSDASDLDAGDLDAGAADAGEDGGDGGL